MYSLENKSNLKNYPNILKKTLKFPKCDSCEIENQPPIIYCPFDEQLICASCYHRKEHHENKRQWFFDLARKKFTNEITSVKNDPNSDERVGIHLLCLCETKISILEIIKSIGGDLTQTNRYGQTQFHELCSRNPTIMQIEFFLKSGCNFRNSDYLKNTAIIFICSKEPELRLLNYCLKNGADLEQKNEIGKNCVHFMFQNSLNLRSLIYLTKLKVDLNCKDKRQKTPLHYFFEEENSIKSKKFIKIVDLCIKNGFDIHSCDEKKETLFHLIVKKIEKDDLWVLDYFLSKGFDPNIPNINNNTPLQMYCESAETTIEGIKMFFGRGLPLDFTIKNAHGSSIFSSICYGFQDLNLIEYILKERLETLNNKNCKSKIKIDINPTKDMSETLLHFVCRRRPSVELMKLFLQNGANVNILNDNKCTAYFYVLEKRLHTTDLEMFLKYGYNVNLDGSAFYICDQCPDKDFIKMFIKEKYNFNEKGDWKGNTAFHKVCKAWDFNFETLKLCLSHGCKLNIKNKKEETPFSWICRYNPDPEILKLCFENGAKCYITDNFDPFRYVCESPKVNLESIKLFYDNTKISFNNKDQSGKTEFDLIMKNDSSLKTIKYCLSKGAKINKGDNRGKSMTTFHYLCQGKPSMQAINFFLQKGADLHLKDQNLKTAFHHICENHLDYEIIQFFLKNGAQLNDFDKEHKTPYQSICRNQKLTAKILKLCYRYDQNLDQKTSDSKTLFHLACNNTNNAPIPILKFFLKRGISFRVCDSSNESPISLLCKNDLTMEKLKLFIKYGSEMDHIMERDSNILLAISQNFRYLYLKNPNEAIKFIEVYLENFGNSKPLMGFLQKSFRIICNQEKIPILVLKAFLDYAPLLNLNERGPYGYTPFNLFCKRKRNYDKLKLFLQKIEFFNINKSDLWGSTPLHFVCKHSNNTFKKVKLLLMYGAEINAIDEKCKTPFHHFVKHHHGYRSIIKFLETNADPSIKNINYITPLTYFMGFVLSETYVKKLLQMENYQYAVLIKNFQLFFEREEFTDYEINGIKVHALLLEFRIQKKIEKIKEILEKYSKGSIELFLKWVYYEKMPDFELKTEEEKSTIKRDKKITLEDYLKQKNNFFQIIKEFDILLFEERFTLKGSLKEMFLDNDSKDFTIIIPDENNESEDLHQNINENSENSENSEEESKGCNVRTIKIHKLVLQCRSELFRGVFLSINEQEIAEITNYSDISYESFLILVEYLYTEKIDEKKLTRKNIEELSGAVDYYQLNPRCSLMWYIQSKCIDEDY
ncbi:ankyrin repeat-containing protein [Anaeramoeba flamelloides]|uniref:Ankyrin repeat-containing protein n=1 Tax=Anaeramoeba flamelloides TaxID=1746091 RepID=A0ABQ8Z079_9EUKA|nr:ankyrin repeat-containing protein [Anaeramoeba flamelloides]